MVSEALRDFVVTETTEYDMIQAIYESDCEAVKIAQGMIILEHVYHVSGNDPEILMEGLGDIARSIGDWFKKIIKFISDFFVKAIKIFTDSMSSLEDFVAHNKEQLLATTVDTTLEGFNFTVLDKPKPDLSVFDNLVNSYNDILSNLSDQKANKIKDDSLEFLKKTNLAKLRGQVLGSNSGYDQDEFVKSVRAFYRGGKEDSHSVTVNQDYIKAIVSHVTELTNGKKSAVADRDRVIKMLGRAESFFNSKVVLSYKDGNTKIQTKKITSNSSSKNLETEAGDAIDYESNYKRYIALINAKYNETKAIANIVNVVITERMNAFVDQVKQEKKAVIKAMNPMLSSAEEAFDYSQSGDDITNYAAIESEMNYSDGPVLEELTLRNMCREVLWYNQVMEGNFDDEIVMEGFFENLLTMVRKFIGRVVDMFHKKAQENTKKYVEWFNDDGVIDALKENAKNKSLRSLDYWSADYNGQLKEVSNALNQAVAPTNNTSICPFSKGFIGDDSIETISNYKDKKRDLDNVIKNYFRCGKAGIDRMEPVTIAGSKLSGNVQMMIDYIVNFENLTRSAINLKARADNLKEPVSENLQLDFDSFLEIEGRHVTETDLAILIQAILPTMEADEGQGTSNASTAPAQATNTAKANAPKPSEPVKTEANKVEDVSDNAKNAAGNEEKNADKDKMKNYYTFNCNLAKKLVANYCTVQEERRKAYIDLLTACADTEHAPVFDGNNYVQIKKRGITEKRGADTEGKDSNKQKSGVKSKVKALANKAKSTFSKKKTSAVPVTASTNVYDKATQGVDWML